jgi:hypothetical protein
MVEVEISEHKIDILKKVYDNIKENLKILRVNRLIKEKFDNEKVSMYFIKHINDFLVIDTQMFFIDFFFDYVSPNLNDIKLFNMLKNDFIYYILAFESKKIKWDNVFNYCIDHKIKIH